MVKELCVLVHGFTGSPAELAPLARVLEQMGYEVASPTLAGHCGTKEEMRKATASSWVNSVRCVVAENIHQMPVHLIGFSMGALIAAMIANEFPVKSLTMLAPAIYHTGPRQLFQEMASLIKATWHRAVPDGTYVRSRLDKLAETPIESVKHFRRVVQLAKPVLPGLTVPVCIIHGERDELVEPRSASYIYSSIGSRRKQIHYLPLSGHMLCLDQEAEQVESLILKFLVESQTTE